MPLGWYGARFVLATINDPALATPARRRPLFLKVPVTEIVGANLLALQPSMQPRTDRRHSFWTSLAVGTQADHGIEALMRQLYMTSRPSPMWATLHRVRYRSDGSASRDCRFGGCGAIQIAIRAARRP